MQPLAMYLDQAKREYVQRALILFRGNRKHTAKALGISVRALHLYINRYDLPPGRPGRPPKTGSSTHG